MTKKTEKKLKKAILNDIKNRINNMDIFNYVKINDGVVSVLFEYVENFEFVVE